MPSRQNDGFTFIELVLVILIISSLAALAVPGFRRTFNNMQFEQVSSDISGVLNYAAANAIFKRTECRVIIDKDKQCFYVEGTSRVYGMPRGIKIDSDKESVLFYPDGRSQSITITLSGTDKIRTFSTEGTRGYVKIK